MMLATLFTAVALTAGPTANAELTAAMARRPLPESYAEIGRLAEAGVPGARALYDGYGALGLAGNGSDFPAACRAWEAGADVSAEAAHMTAECYEHGHGGVTDLPRAVALYTAAGEGGYAKSLCALGNLHVAGKGVAADPVRGAELCRRGAEMGDADAQTDIGNFYLFGSGVIEDHAEAFRWYSLAAAQGQKNASFTLAQMYWNGDTVEKNNDEATRLWLAAYDAGRKDAALELARAYMVKAVQGRSAADLDVDSLQESSRWFEIALPQLSAGAERDEAVEHLALVRRLLAGPEAR